MITPDPKFPEIKHITPDIHCDNRGWFMEVFRQREDMTYAQLNLVYFTQRVLRGLHYQPRSPQGKLYMSSHGDIFQVLVDVRQGSPTFGKSTSVRLSGQDKNMIEVPQGFMSGSLCLTESATLFYATTRFYDPSNVIKVNWNDPDLAIKWPMEYPVLNDADAHAQSFNDAFKAYIYTDSGKQKKGDILLQLAQKHGIKTFVETGTYSGDMVDYLDQNYAWEKMYSIELSERLFEIAFARFIGKSNINIINGDSAEVLPRIIAELDKPALFWLDAHECGGTTAKGRKTCPVIEELSAILSRENNDVIVIDDRNNFARWGIDEAKICYLLIEMAPYHKVTFKDTMLICEPEHKV